MGGGGGSKVAETPQQRAMTDHALQQLDDYRARWLPLQQHVASQIQSMGKPGSVERTQAAGRTTADSSMRFAGVQGTVESNLANTVGLGSSRSKLALGGVGDDAAKSRGLGLTIANQRVDDAYTQALGALAATGRGEKATVSSSMAQQAAMSGQQAASDASISLQNRMNNAQLGGQVIGLGMQQGFKGFGSGSSGGIPVSNDFQGVNGGNAMDQFMRYGTGGD